MTRSLRITVTRIAGLLLAGSIGWPALHAADALDQSLQLTGENNRQEQQTQARIDTLSEQTRAMLEEYQQLSREYTALKVYNDQMERIIRSQEADKAALAEQVAEVDLTRREIMPLMLRMIAALESFLETDIPFLPEERHQRVAQLRDLIDRADVTLAEKYRRVLEAYQVEMEYGRTFEAYRDELDVNGMRRTVDVLRVGRLGLYYQTLGGDDSGYWDAANRRWVAVNGSDRVAIRQGLRVARQQVAPELLTLQVAVPEGERP